MPPIIFNDFDLKFYLVVVNCMYVGDVLSLTVSNEMYNYYYVQLLLLL